MPEPSEIIFNQLKEDEKYKKYYLHAFELDTDNPLAQVTPFNGDFFGTKVCNLICFTGIVKDWDETIVATCLARLEEVYSHFAKYETHFLIDAESEKYNEAPAGQKTEMQDQLQQLAEDGQSIGFFYWGALSRPELREKMVAIINAFYGIPA